MLVISLVSMFIVMPFIALALAVAFDPPQLVRVALVATALSPVPPFLPTKVRDAGGRASYGLGLMATFSILSIVLVPVWVEFLGALMGRPFHQGPAAVAGQVLVAAAAPLAPACWCARSCPAWQTGSKSPLPWSQRRCSPPRPCSCSSQCSRNS
jgi:BASS family bile acid:Na+ symporter